MSTQALKLMKIAASMLCAFLVFASPKLSGASPTEYTLDCAAPRVFPSGVPATFTSRDNVKTFREWCDQAGTETLIVYVDTSFDARIFEQMGLPNAKMNDTDILENIAPKIEIETVENSKTTAPVNATTDYPLIVKDDAGVVHTFSSYDSGTDTYTYASTDGSGNPVTTSLSVADWLDDCGDGSCVWNLKEVTPGLRTTRSKTVKPKAICPSNKVHYFVNSKTGEATSNFIGGGSCFDVFVKTVSTTILPSDN